MSYVAVPNAVRADVTEMSLMEVAAMIVEGTLLPSADEVRVFAERVLAQEQQLDLRHRHQANTAVAGLSFTEVEAAAVLFERLPGPKGVVTASKIADECGCTRSTLVTAMRKLQSAGVIETRSLGMKGTHIKVLNDMLPEALIEKQRKQHVAPPEQPISAAPLAR